jgi:hypothetical protein
MRIAGRRCTSGTCAIHSWTLDNLPGVVDRPSHNGGKDQTQQPVGGKRFLACGSLVERFQHVGLLEFFKWSNAAQRKRIALLSICHNGDFA